jgi:hypothetical protein
MQKISGDISISPSSETIGTVQVVQLWSLAYCEPPTLNMRAEMKMRPLIQRGQQQPTFHPVTLLRVIGEFRSPEQRVVARFQDDLPFFASDPNRDATNQVVFEIPLDLLAIDRIEAERNGGDLRVGLKLRLLAALHGANGAVNFHSGSVSDMNVTIPRSDWVEKYLPALGYGGLEILEIRYGSGVEAKGLRDSVAEIKEAKKYLAEGQWDKAALHCRMAIEQILTSKPASATSPHFEQKVNTFINDNLPGIDDTEARMLSEQMKLIWKAASTAVHGNPQHTFKRADAEFVLRMTMAIVEYFGRLLR